MRLSLTVSAMTTAMTVLAAALTPDLALAQAPGGQMLPPGGFHPPPPAPVKPYKPIAITPPTPFTDPSFQAFRKQIADIAAHKDRAALGKLVTQNFFWMQDKDLADKRKPGIENLAKAIDLNAKDGSGWDVLAGFAGETTAAELPDQKGVFCAPADPEINPQEFEALAKSTGTDPAEWGYPLHDGLELHAAAQATSPVTEKLAMTLIRVLPDSAGAGGGPPQFLHVAAPDGKSGYVAADGVGSLGGDQMCYSKDAGGWKISGYFGGVSQ